MTYYYFNVNIKIVLKVQCSKMRQNATTKLSEQQLTAISMLTAGVKMTTIAKHLKIDRTTLWRWRREKDFLEELYGRRNQIFFDITSKLTEPIEDGLKNLSRLANNKDGNIPPREQLEASKSLVESPLKVFELVYSTQYEEKLLAQNETLENANNNSEE